MFANRSHAFFCRGHRSSGGRQFSKALQSDQISIDSKTGQLEVGEHHQLCSVAASYVRDRSRFFLALNSVRPLADVVAMFTAADLRNNGFLGFVSWSGFSRTDVPDRGGVYVVLHPAEAAPVFQTVSFGGHFKGLDPSVTVEVLRRKWLANVETTKIGKATSLRSRLGQYRSFGSGKPVGHWGGRYIWQLAQPQELRVCWKSSSTPEAEESSMLRCFADLQGSLPFANLRH